MERFTTTLQAKKWFKRTFTDVAYTTVPMDIFVRWLRSMDQDRLWPTWYHSLSQKAVDEVHTKSSVAQVLILGLIELMAQRHVGKDGKPIPTWDSVPRLEVLCELLPLLYDQEVRLRLARVPPATEPRRQMRHSIKMAEEHIQRLRQKLLPSTLGTPP